MCLVYLYLSAYGIFYCLLKPSLDITSSDELSIVQRSIVLSLCVGWLFFSWLFFFQSIIILSVWVLGQEYGTVPDMKEFLTEGVIGIL